MKFPLALGRAAAAAACLALGAAGLARAPGLARADDDADRLARKLKGYSAAELRSAGALKALSRDPDMRRAFLLDTASAAPPREAALPLLVDLLRSEADDRNRIAAWKLLGHVGLECDRDELRARAFPDLHKRLGLTRPMAEDRFALEEAVRLNGWFHLDQELAKDFQAVFEGEDFNLRSIGFAAVEELEEPSLDDKLARPDCFRVLEATRGFSLFDRRRAIKGLARRGDARVVPVAAAALTGEGPIAVESANALALLKDARALDELRKIGRSAVHDLRAAAFRARARMSDPLCADELAGLLEDDNGALIARLVETLGEARDPKSKALLETLAKGQYPPARAERFAATSREGELAKERRSWVRAAALALMSRGDDLGREKLQDELAKEPAPAELEDLASRALRVADPLADSFVVIVLAEARLTGAGARTLAAARAGEHRLKDALPLLDKIVADTDQDPALRLEAHASRVELGKEKALADWNELLKTYDGARRNEEDFEVAGQKTKLSRYGGSVLLGILARIERKGDAAELPLIESLLEPRDLDPSAPAPSPAPSPKAASGTGTTSGAKPGAGAAPVVSSRPRRVRDQFVRRRAVEVASKIGGEKAARLLARGWTDPRSTVREAALREIARLSGKFALARGADAAEEAKDQKPAEAWLKEHQAWPAPE